MGSLRNATPVELLAWHTGGQVAEAVMHRRFAHLRLDGEWFFPGQELLAHIRHVRDRMERRGTEKDVRPPDPQARQEAAPEPGRTRPKSRTNFAPIEPLRIKEA